jgi:hypothetical protein
MSRVLRGAALIAATATLALLSGLPAAVAESAHPEFTCANGPFFATEPFTPGSEVMGTGCRVDVEGAGGGLIHFQRDNSTYGCVEIERLRPGGDGSFSVVGTNCTDW